MTAGAAGAVEPGPLAAGRRLRVLVVTSQYPDPPTWGAGMRVYQLARHLSQDHDVTLLSYSPAGTGTPPTRREALCQEVRLVPRDALRGAARRVQQARSLVSARPFNARTLYTAPMQRALDLALAEGFDVVQVEGSPLMCLDYGSTTPVVLDEHNIESEVLRRMGRSERSLARRAFNAAEAAKYRHVEADAWHRAATCVVTSDREVPAVQAVAAGTPVAVVPNAVDPAHFHQGATTSRVQPECIVFTGLLRYRPNVDAAQWFAQDVLPLVRLRHPAARFVVVGDGSPTDLDDLRALGAEVTGLVPDLRPYLAGAACVVAPLRMGGGTRLKVLEALAMSRPLVSTSLGCEGIHVVDGRDMLVADETEAVAEAVSRLLNDPALAARLGAAGRRLVVEDYSWERSAERLRAVHRSLAEARR